MTNDLFTYLQSFFTPQNVLNLVRVAIMLVMGVTMARGISATVGHIVAAKAGNSNGQTARRFSYYLVMTLVILTFARYLGLDLSVFLGAAGVLTVAFGFASQTSASNIISGLFLLGEQPYAVGDIISVSGITGEVIEIGLLSVKLRTQENLLVRIPNEVLLKSPLTNRTRYPITRLDLQFDMASGLKLDEASRRILEIARRNPLCLVEPLPQLKLVAFTESKINVEFSVWVTRENYSEVRSNLVGDLHRELTSEGLKRCAGVSSVEPSAALEEELSET